MKAVEELTRRNLTVLLLLMLLAGFVTLLAELLITGHVDGVQNVAVIASVIGAAGVTAGIFVKGVVRHVVVLLLLVLTVSGLMGVREHFEAREQAATVTASTAAVDLAGGYQPIADARSIVQAPSHDEDEENENRAETEGAAPPLAPLSLSGLALMGAVVLLAKQDE